MLVSESAVEKSTSLLDALCEPRFKCFLAGQELDMLSCKVIFILTTLFDSSLVLLFRRNQESLLMPDTC